MEKPSIVLIVEDDALLAEMALEMIEDVGRPAIAVDSVDAALDYLKENSGRVSAMFSDVRLKGPLNGVELAAFVAVRWPNIAICVTSGVALERPYRLPKQRPLHAQALEGDRGHLVRRGGLATPGLTVQLWRARHTQVLQVFIQR